MDKITTVIERYSNENTSYHDLRTRKSGNRRYIDFHMNLPAETTVKEAHDLCDLIETEIHQSVPHSEVTIHVENS